MSDVYELTARNYWNKIWNRFLKYHGMITPAAKLLQQLINHVPRSGIILDLGSGEGRNSLYLSQVGYSVIGLDLSFKASQVMNNNFFEEELKGLAMCADARCLPFLSNSFDGILAHHLFDNIDSKSFVKAFSEAYRVLKPTGVMLLTLDSFKEFLSKNQTVRRDDGSFVAVKGLYKGMLVRPFAQNEVDAEIEKGWVKLVDEQTPKGCKILLLKKAAVTLS